MNKIKIKKFIEQNNVLIVFYIVLILFLLYQIIKLKSLDHFFSSSTSSSGSNTKTTSSSSNRTTSSSSNRTTSSSSNRTTSSSNTSSKLDLQKCLNNKNKNNSNPTKTVPTEYSNVNHQQFIHSILPAPENTYGIKYYASFIPDKKLLTNNNNFVIIKGDLKSNTWETVNINGNLNNNSIIIDLTYDKYKRIMCLGMYIKGNNPIYDLYVKETTDYKSKWILLSKDVKVKSLCYDLKTEKLLGVHSYDSQIYECDFYNPIKKPDDFMDIDENLLDINRQTNKVLKRPQSSSIEEFVGSQNNKIELDWVGPINYDLPMKKIMFDKDGIMIGIHFYDNYIYKKKRENWRQSDWDTENINKTKVFDLCYDIDGCFIGSSFNGIQKQLYPDFNSSFVHIKKYKSRHNEIMDINDILKCKIGIEYLDIFGDDTELSKDLKRLYEFKKITKDMCKNKKYLIDKNNLDSSVNKYDEALNKQNRQISELYDYIDELSEKLELN